MKRPKNLPRNQRVLCLEQEEQQRLEEATREALINAIADLLLEAYGTEGEVQGDEQGDRHEG